MRLLSTHEMPITTYIETIPLSEFERDRAKIVSSCFSDGENPSQLRLPTLAGFLCVKKALVAAIRTAGGIEVPDVAQFVLGRTSEGAPVILRMPDSVLQRFVKICISLSHTRTHACGCVAVEGGEPDAG